MDSQYQQSYVGLFVQCILGKLQMLFVCHYVSVSVSVPRRRRTRRTRRSATHAAFAPTRSRRRRTPVHRGCVGKRMQRHCEREARPDDGRRMVLSNEHRGKRIATKCVYQLYRHVARRVPPSVYRKRMVSHTSTIQPHRNGSPPTPTQSQEKRLEKMETYASTTSTTTSSTRTTTTTRTTTSTTTTTTCRTGRTTPSTTTTTRTLRMEGTVVPNGRHCVLFESVGSP